MLVPVITVSGGTTHVTGGAVYATAAAVLVVDAAADGSLLLIANIGAGVLVVNAGSADIDPVLGGAPFSVNGGDRYLLCYRAADAIWYAT